MQGLASGDPKAVVPWGFLHQDGEELIPPNYIPATIALQDPSRMTKEDYVRLLAHWRKRKEQSQVVFRFSHFLKGDKTVSEAIYSLKPRLVNPSTGEGSKGGRQAAQPKKQKDAPPMPNKRRTADSDDEDMDQGDRSWMDVIDKDSDEEDEENGDGASDKENSGEEDFTAAMMASDRLCPSSGKDVVSQRPIFLASLTSDARWIQLLGRYGKLKVSICFLGVFLSWVC